MVRIVGGKARGLKLDVLANQGIRPTTDRVREALFNIIGHRYPEALDNTDVLDLFAGTGALGLEALSRGARFVQFVEAKRAHAELLKRNVEKMSGRTHIQRVDAQVFLASTRQKFDLIFVDPPYHESYYESVLKQVCAVELMNSDALVCDEHPTDLNLVLPVGLTRCFERKYGATHVTLLKRK